MSTSPRYLGKYELRERLGRGGMGEVWKAFDAQLQRYVAIKVLHADLQNDPSFVSRFRREAQVVASLHHPNIVQIYDFQISQPPDSESTTAYMVMDYVEGQTLANYIRSTSRIGQFPSTVDILHLFAPISAAIDYAHQKGMIHRDIKPSNILLDKRNTSRHPLGELILTDFGIAKMLGTSTGTLTGWWLGTPLYTSPEQARGSLGNERSDLYSLGVILYEICTGMLPFQGDNPAAILMQHINAAPTSPAFINPAIPPALNAIILHSLAKDPADRFPSASSMVVALAEALNRSIPQDLSQAAYLTDAMNESASLSPIPSSLPVSLTPLMSPSPSQIAVPPSRLSLETPSEGAQGPSPTGVTTGATPSAALRSAQNTSGSSSLPTAIQGRLRYFMPQQYAEGETLEERIVRLNQPMEERDVLIYATQLLDILDHLEQQVPPIVHGDIRPANILIGAKDKRAHLVDFGIVAADVVQNQMPLVGTPGYAALEQLQGKVDPRSDLYSLAATMHHLLTNRNPHNHPPFAYPPVRMLTPRLSPEVEGILLRALTPEVTQRYQSAAEMKHDIDNLLLRRYGLSSNTGNYMQGVSRQVEAVGVASSASRPNRTKFAERLRVWLHLPGATSSAHIPIGANQPAHANHPTSIHQQASPGLRSDGPTPAIWQGPPYQSTGGFGRPPQLLPPQRPRGNRRGKVLVFVLVFVLIVAGLSSALLFLRNMHTTTTTTPKTGIGVTKAPNGQYIGISDGTFAFDTDRADGNLKRQAADKLKAGDPGSADSLWQQAVALETNDAEALIYLEDQRVLDSGSPYITIVVGTTLTGDTGSVGVGRENTQGAYVAQQEYNAESLLPGGVQVRLLIANSGSVAAYATSVAQQIAQLARTDKTVVGVIGWGGSAQTLNAIRALAAAKIPMVSNASGDSLTGRSSYFFRVVTPASIQGSIGAQYVEQTLHVKTAAVFIDPANDYSSTSADGFIKRFTGDGNTIVATENYTVGKSQTIPGLLQDALSKHPGVLYFAGYPADVSVLLTHLQPSDPPVMGGPSLYQTTAYSQVARSYLGHLHFTANAYPDEWDNLGLSAQKPAFFADYKLFYDPQNTHSKNPYGFDRPDAPTMLSYDIISVLLYASKLTLAAKSSFVGSDLAQTLKGITGKNAFQGISGVISFGRDGNPVNKATAILCNRQGFFMLDVLLGQFQLEGSIRTQLPASSVCG